MSIRALTNDEYLRLAGKLFDEEQPAIQQSRANEIKQAHRLLCEGRKLEDLTPQEQHCAGIFKGAHFACIPSADGGWEPGIEVEDKPEAKATPKKKKEDD